MPPNRKRKVAEDLMKAMQTEDRISNLPSCLIGHILSFLPTKYAVATSVLSTKWKNMWKLTTDLDFNDELLQYPSRALPSSSFLKTSFVDFVGRVLLFGGFPCLRKFKLGCSQRYDEFHITSWVASALKYDVQELDVAITGYVVLPNNLFTCKTLVQLKLVRGFAGGSCSEDRGFSMSSPAHVLLPCLKDVDLIGFKFSDNDSITRFLSGCPVLEKLHLCKCIGIDVNVVHISAPLLKTLKLARLPYDYDHRHFNFKVVLDTPCLSHLSISDCLAQGYVLKGIQHLTRAEINVHHYRFLDFGTPAVFNALKELLRRVSGVASLMLAAKFIEAIKLCEFQLPIFQNVTHLVLGADFSRESYLFPELLQCSPLLETLEFKDGLGHHHSCECRDWNKCRCQSWNPPKDVPTCLMFHLKVINIMRYDGYPMELQVVEYFTKNACILEKLFIKTSLGNRYKKKLEVSTSLLMLPRASKICQIELVY